MNVLRILHCSGLFLTVRTIETIVCEMKKKNISCRDEPIKITSANYGRTYLNICGTPTKNNTNCKANKSLEIIKGLCDGQYVCELYASNAIFGDPCVGVVKYLNVSHECRERVNDLKNGLGRTVTKSIPDLTISGFVGDVHLISHGKVFNEALTCSSPQVTRCSLALQHKQNSCGGTFTDTTGVIQSPNFPNVYPNNKICIYLVTQPMGMLITLSFISFDLEDSSHCTYDYLEVSSSPSSWSVVGRPIRDGGSSDSSLLGRYCDAQVPPDVVTTQNMMWIKFVSDDTVEKTGFQATYTASEASTIEINTETTTIRSTSSNIVDITTDSSTTTGSSAITYSDTTTGSTDMNVTTVIANKQDINTTGTIVGVVLAVFLVFILCTIAAVCIRKRHHQQQSSKSKYVHKADNVTNRNCSPIKTDPSKCNEMNSDTYELAGPSTNIRIPHRGYDNIHLTQGCDVVKLSSLDKSHTSSNNFDYAKRSGKTDIPIGYDLAQLPGANGNQIANEYELFAKAKHSSANHIPSDYEFLKPTETDYSGADYVYTDYREGEYDNLHAQRRKINNGENNIYAHTNIGDTEETPYDVTGGQLSQYDANNYDHTTFRADDYAMAGHLSEKDDPYDHSNI